MRVEPASRGDLIEIVSVPGEIQPLKKVAISAKVAAPIVESYTKDLLVRRIYEEIRAVA